MSTKIAAKEETLVKIPLSLLRCISRYPKEGKAIFEINLKDLKKYQRKPNMLDKMVAEARLEYFNNELEGFDNTEDLMKALQ